MHNISFIHSKSTLFESSFVSPSRDHHCHCRVKTVNIVLLSDSCRESFELIVIKKFFYRYFNVLNSIRTYACYHCRPLNIRKELDSHEQSFGTKHSGDQTPYEQFVLNCIQMLLLLFSIEEIP